MTFISLEFGIFILIVLIIFWLLKSRFYYQKILLLLSSNFFYGYYDYRFLLILNFTIFSDFISGILINKTSNRLFQKLILIIAITISLLLMFYFKYLNFIIQILNDSFNLHIFKLNIILPIGISFYTFHGISYLIDVYNKKIKSESSILNYSLFVSYFPLLVAGPIERAGNLLNQFKKKKNIFDYSSFVNGMQLILIGFFKKIVLSDNLSLFVDDIYINSENYNGATLMIGTFFFAFQIYFDFSGYSDIASGLAKLFGQKLIINFNYPYLTKNIIEFWQKWHISLSSFFKDYIYIPIGGNTNKNIYYVRNILFIFLISGIWHGANLNFIIWGLYHGLLYLISKIIIKLIKFPIKNNYLNGLAYIMNFTLISIGWIFFRSDDINQSFKILRNIFCSEIFDFPYFKNGSLAIPFIFLSLFFLLFEKIAKSKKLDSPIFLIQKIKSTLTRNIVYYLIIFLILYLGNYQNNSFIYFQF